MLPCVFGIVIRTGKLYQFAYETYILFSPLFRRVAEAIDNKDCRGFEGNMELEIAEADAFLYPDLMVVCGEIEFSEKRSDALTNPVLIIEVLSPSTESFDRGRKFKYYQMIPSLKEYMFWYPKNRLGLRFISDRMRTSGFIRLQKDLMRAFFSVPSDMRLR